MSTENTEKAERKLSDRQGMLAAQAGEAYQRHQRSSREAIEAYLAMGAFLIEAQGECSHGEFGLVLERAGIPRTTAYRGIRLAKAGACPEVLESLGIRRADAWAGEGNELSASDNVTASYIKVCEAIDRLKEMSRRRVLAYLKFGRACTVLRDEVIPNIGEVGFERALACVAEDVGKPIKAFKREAKATMEISASDASISEMIGLYMDDCDTAEDLARKLAKRARKREAA